MDVALMIQVEEAMKLGINLDDSRAIYEALAAGDEEAARLTEEERIARRNTEVMGAIDAALGGG